MSGLWIVAGESWRRMSAARATMGFAVLFSLLAIGVSYFGLAGQRSVGFQGFARMTTSLFNLVVYLVPLIALIIGAAEVTGRRENLSLFLVQPIRRSAVLLGSYLGVAAALAAAVIVGLGGAGLFISLRTSTASIGPYLVLLAASIGLLLSFLAMGFLLGVFLLDRLRAMAASILLWFIAVIGYDLGIIGISSVFRGLPLKTILFPAILLNPVDLCRVMVTVASGRGALFGPAGANLVNTFGAPMGATVAAVAIVMLIVIPVLIMVRVFEKRDL